MCSFFSSIVWAYMSILVILLIPACWVGICCPVHVVLWFRGCVPKCPERVLSTGHFQRYIYVFFFFWNIRTSSKPTLPMHNTSTGRSYRNFKRRRPHTNISTVSQRASPDHWPSINAVYCLYINMFYVYRREVCAAATAATYVCKYECVNWTVTGVSSLARNKEPTKTTAIAMKEKCMYALIKRY